MSTLTVFADVADGRIQSDNTTYATARSGGALLVYATFTTIFVGQNFATSTYHVHEGFEGFDTSALTADATVSAVVLSLWGQANWSNTDFTIQCRLYDWGATVTTADWIAGASLTGQTLLAHFATSGFSVTGYNDFVDDAFAANVNRTGVTRIILDGSRTEAGTAPTGNEHVSYYSADQTGTTNDPKLVVTYTAPEAYSGSLVASASTGIASTGTKVASGAAPSQSASTAVSGFVAKKGAAQIVDAIAATGVSVTGAKDARYGSLAVSTTTGVVASVKSGKAGYGVAAATSHTSTPGRKSTGVSVSLGLAGNVSAGGRKAASGALSEALIASLVAAWQTGRFGSLGTDLTTGLSDFGGVAILGHSGSFSLLTATRVSTWSPRYPVASASRSSGSTGARTRGVTGAREE